MIADKRTVNSWKGKRWTNIEGVPYDHKFKYLGVMVDYANQRMIKVVKEKVTKFWQATNGMLQKLIGNIRRKVSLQTIGAICRYQLDPMIKTGVVKTEEARSIVRGIWRKALKMRGDISNSTLETFFEGSLKYNDNEDDKEAYTKKPKTTGQKIMEELLLEQT